MNNLFIKTKLTKSCILKLSSMISTNSNYLFILFFLMLETQSPTNFEGFRFLPKKLHPGVPKKVINTNKHILFFTKTLNLHRIH